MVKNTILALFAFILLAGVSIAQTREEPKVGDFSGIRFGTSGTLYLTQGTTNSVVLEGDRDDLEEIETYVRGDVLVIRQRSSRRWFSWGDHRIDAYVTVKDLNSVSVGGSGKIIGKSNFKTGNLDVSVSGSGRIELTVNAEDLDISISGSGSIELDGSGKRADLSISGSGRLRAEDLEADSYDVDISGSGSATVNVREELNADISGSGVVRYRGNPDKIRADVSGSGTVRKI